MQACIHYLIDSRHPGFSQWTILVSQFPVGVNSGADSNPKHILCSLRYFGNSDKQPNVKANDKLTYILRQAEGRGFDFDSWHRILEV